MKLLLTCFCDSVTGSLEAVVGWLAKRSEIEAGFLLFEGYSGFIVNWLEVS